MIKLSRKNAYATKNGIGQKSRSGRAEIALFSLLLAVFGATTVATINTAPVSAANAFNQQACNGLSEAERDAIDCDETNTAPPVITNLLQVASSVIGIVAVIMIVVAGQRFVTSNGDPEKIKQARNMVLYSVIALIVAGLAFAIVTFVQNSIS